MREAVATELHVVALSGGKDSTAMALRLAEVAPRDYVYVCTPTGNELPAMFEHWRRLSELLGATIHQVIAGSLVTMICEQEALPNWRMRWCTRKLKIEPYAAWLMKQAGTHGRIVSYVGLRADEPEREGGDYLAVPGVEMVFPMRTWGWGLQEVSAYLVAKGVTIPKRTDCALCFYQRLGEWWELWKHYPDQWALGEYLESRTGHTFRSPGRDKWPASMKDLRAEFESGRHPKDAGKRDLFQEMQCRVCRT